MNRSRVLLVFLVLLPASAGAQSLQNAILRNSFAPVGAGARAGGMGGAFLAIADDGTAASFNPAGLAQLRRPELAVVAYDDILESSIDLSSGAFPLDSVSERHSVPQFLGLAKPLVVGSRRLALQLSYERTVDLVGKGRAAALLAVEGDGDLSDVAYLAELQSAQTGAMHTVTAAAGIEVVPGLMAGAATSLWIGEWTASGVEEGSLVVGRPVQSIPIDRDEFRQEHSMRGVSLNLGVLARRSWLSMGGVVRLPFAARYEVQEHSVVSELVEAGSPVISEGEQRMRTILHWPISAGVGVAVRPVAGLTVAADAAWTAWQTTTIDNVPDGALLTPSADDEDGALFAYLDRNFFDLFPASESFTGATGGICVGAEYLLNLPRFVVPLRVGHAWEESPVPELGSLDARRNTTATVGLGLSFQRVAFDLAFQRRTGSGAVGANLSGADLVEFPTEDVTDRRVVSSLILRF